MARTYEVRTFGCQMNKHDSERIAGLLLADGMEPVALGATADVVVFNTCCVRENADERFYGQLQSLQGVKRQRQDMLIAVGGCVGQRDRETLLKRSPHVDVVFGTHNIAHLPALLSAAASSPRSTVEILEDEEPGFTHDLPSVREHPWHAWVPIAIGCDNHCTYCIVPHVRGRERSRPFEQIVDEVRHLAADGVAEITLLGQNVNSYGRDLYGSPRFAELLRAVAAAGARWIRFTTSHPKDLGDDIIEAMSSTPQVCRHLHLPVQSGSDRILSAMNRRYTSAHYLALVAKLYAAMPDLALSTDVIVGFPGETDEDFEATMALVEQARYDQAFTFIYSPRAGTPAASMTDRVPRELTQVRFDRLVATVQASAAAKNLPLVGTTQRVLFEGPSKRDASMLMGRTGGNKAVHVPVPRGRAAQEYAGSFADVAIEEAQTWFCLGSFA